MTAHHRTVVHDDDADELGELRGPAEVETHRARTRRKDPNPMSEHANHDSPPCIECAELRGPAEALREAVTDARAAYDDHDARALADAIDRTAAIAETLAQLAGAR